ncbi:MAG: hypothetical protein COW84_07310 [Gammaproteobacteria bacterium CG22_combo_CG10-13_8_21_14_all_40_8]|nr:MAG: hypothetical protein COW84_07310 [Gammaproteobacteria bacterium CG22_combo_CG10-13_8_21_14_all_40_8]
MKNKKLKIALLLIGLGFNLGAQAASYKIDTQGMHAFIQFKIKHLGYSWVLGDFKKFEGSFEFDENKPDESKVEVSIETASVETNHAERNKHLRGSSFLDSKQFPTAKFVSRSFKQISADKALLTGDLSLHGVTKSVNIDVDYIGRGKDPWGGYRAGFSGTTIIALADYNILTNLGDASKEVNLFFSIEGIRQ